VMDWICDEFRKESGIDLQQDRMALQRIKDAAEKAKKELSTVTQTEVNLPFITADASGPKHLSMNLTRAKLEQLVGDLIDKTLDPVRQALTDAGISASQVNDVVLVGGQTRTPKVQESIRQFFNKEPVKGINPDEAVALGAAIQAGVLKGDVGEVLLLDVTPLTLGIETLGGVATPLIPRNTTIPTEKSQIFSTATDNQNSVEIHVIQGERPMAADNRTLGRFMLDGIMPAPRGVPQIEVTFEIDANGILNVSARDKGTGKEQKITITASSGLSKEEVENMRQQAEQHASQDASRREQAETRNAADSLVYTAEKTLREHGDKIPAEIKGDIESKAEALRNALQGEDIAPIRTAMQALSDAVQKAGGAVYGEQGQGDETAGGPAGGGEEPPEDTVEGEFREI